MEPTLKLETRTNTNTTTTSIRTSNSSTPFDWEYFKSIPGILKFIELLFGILAIGLATPPHFFGTYFFLFVCYICLTITLFLVVVYFFNIHHKFTVRPSWISMEFYYTILATFFYTIAMIIQFTIFSNKTSNDSTVSRAIASGVFALFNTIIYGIGLFFIFTEWRNWRNNRGAIPVSRG